jgi:hypothetical protein
MMGGIKVIHLNLVLAGLQMSKFIYEFPFTRVKPLIAVIFLYSINRIFDNIYSP